MKTLIIALIITLLSFSSVVGQNKLIPYDSTNYKYIADTLFNEIELLAGSEGGYPINDTILRQMYNPQRIKKCPCLRENENNIVSYKSSSFFIKENRCLSLFKENNNYKIRTGVLEKNKLNNKYDYLFNEGIIKENKAKKIIKLITEEINNREIPSYNELLIVYDGVEYVFGNELTNEYGVKDPLIESKSLDHLIKILNRIIKRNSRNK